MTEQALDQEEYAFDDDFPEEPPDDERVPDDRTKRIPEDVGDAPGPNGVEAGY